jgi:hypothetical protein
MTHSILNRLWLGAAISVGITGMPSVMADSATFTIDPAQSSITISGTVAGGTIKEQGAGSLTTKFAGTIRAEVNNAAIQFSGGSQISAQNNGNWAPAANGATGTAPANYGGIATVVIIQANAAVRNIQLDAFSGPLTVSDGHFDSTGLFFMFSTNSASVLDYNAGLFGTGSEALAGYATNQVTTVATLATSGSTQVLTIPVNANHVFELITPDDSQLILKGQLVATRSAAPSLRILGITVENQTVTVEWQSSPGQKYLVQSSLDLKNWTQRAPEVTATAATSTWSAAVDNRGEFFRLAQ